MADIQEIPLDITENTKEIQEDAPTIQEIVQDIPPPVEDITVEDVKPIKARAKGRPKGAANKNPPKARVKKASIQETPVEEEAYVPSSPTRNLRIPTDPSNSDVAAAMLKLLQDQTNSRQSRKQRLYNSWFA